MKATLRTLLLILPCVLALRARPLAGQAPGEGRIAGKVVDKETGRGVAGARVLVVGQTGSYESDLSGAYRTQPLQTGTYSVRVSMIGFTPVQADSVRVVPGQTASANFVLSAATVQLQEIEVTSTAVRASNDAGLLALQQSAPTVSDGISAQAIAKSPDQNAGDALKRVTGVSVVDGKFLVVRGLGERYSNALLNGAEIASPVLDKKIPPLDLFPAALLESVVASKTATPDKPGDFAGGSVELKTKDFPEQRVAQFELKFSGNDQVSFKELPLAPQSGLRDWLGVTGDRRVPPAVPALPNDRVAITGILQSFRNNVWNPAPGTVGLKPGFTLSYGDQKQGERSSLGYILSFNYNKRTAYTPERRYNIFYLGHEGTNGVDWGGILNLAWKANASNKLFLRNLYTRSADEQTRFASGTATQVTGAPDDNIDAVYQVRYTERYVLQTQLGGEHRLRFPFAFPSFFEWKGTYGAARIYDPDNHSAKFSTNTNLGGTEASAFRLTRVLDDKTYSGQLDWSVPLSLRHAEDALAKFGGYYRVKNRDYQAEDFYLSGGNDPSVRTVVNAVPVVPEDVFAPENLASFGVLPREPNDPYEATEKVSAAYGMLDLPLTPWFRAVGGLRLERWQLDILNGGDDPTGDKAAGKTSSLPAPKDVTDRLWSVNLTISPSSSVNFRLAGYRTVARPDIREVSPSKFTSVNGLGECTYQGNPELTRTAIKNFDARLEFYPRPGELLAISGFHKEFDQPIVVIRTTGAGAGSNVPCFSANAKGATLTGAEFEFRKSLDFLARSFDRFSLGSNVALIKSSIDVSEVLGIDPRKFIGQSPVVVNAYLGYAARSGGFDANVLVNYVGERLNTYSNREVGNSTVPTPNPNWVEQARTQVDAKIRIGLARRMRLALSGRNLTRTDVVVKEDSDPNRTVSRYNPGVSFSTSITYDF